MKKETNEVDNKLQNFKNDLLEFDKKLMILVETVDDVKEEIIEFDDSEIPESYLNKSNIVDKIDTFVSDISFEVFHSLTFDLDEQRFSKNSVLTELIDDSLNNRVTTFLN